MIELRGVAKTYDSVKGRVVALDDVNLSIPPGEIFGVIGRSGAGKSTLIRCVNLLERPDAGQVLLDGRDLTALAPAELRSARRSVGMIFQHFNLLSSRTVFGNVALPLELRPRRAALEQFASALPEAALVAPPVQASDDRLGIEATVRPLLELVGLADKAERYPAELSGGQKQRVGVARALANRPKVLLCDEATSALDPETTASILALLKDINRKLGLTIVLITHEMAVVRAICDRVAVLEQGRVVEQGGVFDVFTRPQTETTRAFMRELAGDEPPVELLERARARSGEEPATLLRIGFTGPAADEPVLSQIARRFELDLNILRGRIEDIQGASFGDLHVLASGAPNKVEAAVNWLRLRQLNVEVLGDVARTHRAAG